MAAAENDASSSSFFFHHFLLILVVYFFFTPRSVVFARFSQLLLVRSFVRSFGRWGIRVTRRRLVLISDRANDVPLAESRASNTEAGRWNAASGKSRPT